MIRPLTAPQLAFDVGIAGLAVVLRLVFGFTDLGMGLAILLLGAAFAMRRLSPEIALGLAWLGAIVQMAGANPPDPADLAILAVLYSTARYGEGWVRWLGLASAGVGAIVASVYLALQGVSLSTASLSDALAEAPRVLVAGGFLFIASVTTLGLSWTIGQLARTWDDAERQRRAKAEAEQEVIIEQERNRIARDMHDVVAHSLAVVVAQADGARYAKDAGAKDAALATISGTAREALADVRLLLAQLRHQQEAGPQPVLDDLDRLVDQLRASGLTVEVHGEGEPVALATGRQLAVYRIAQEALTNALRHGDTRRPVRLRMRWHADALELSVTSALGDGEPGSGGHGVPGMRERAVLVGGTLDAGPEDGAWVVRARIPVREAA
ncbi:MAG TPA: histidine kinase [Rhodoglobus sp.]|nr:histidine kinase [Rhodoglobus sp.]